MRKRIDPAQAKAKRQKKILVVLGVVMAALLAFQLPKLLKKDSPAAAPTATAPAQGGTTTTTTPSGGATLASANPGSSADLPDEPDPAPVPQRGQLVSFDLFKSKDPFVPQLKVAQAGSPGAESPPASTPTESTPPAGTPPELTPPATTPPASEPPASAPPAAEPPATEPAPEKVPTSATISVNGISEVVKIGDAFPKADPLFRLVSIKDGVAKITIAGGSLQDGAEAVSLTKGEPLTLMNTADGTKYLIRLVSVA